MTSIFSKIIAREIPGHFIWEDTQAVAIMTIQPIRPGHVLVIPKAEVDHWDQLDPAIAAHLMGVSQHIAGAIKSVFQPQRVGLMIAGLEVPHTHIHLMPIDHMGDMSFSNAKNASAEELEGIASKLRDALANAGHAQAALP